MVSYLGWGWGGREQDHFLVLDLVPVGQSESLIISPSESKT